MNTSKFKKALSIFLAILMVFSALPVTVFAAEGDLPVMKAYPYASNLQEDYHYYKASIVTVTILDEIDYNEINASDTLYSWDVSAAEDSSVMAWMKLNSEETTAAGADRYDVYIAGEGGIEANEDSSDLFFGFTNLKEINGLELFKTGNVTTFDCMFQNCSSLETLDLSSFDTSSATDLSYMFSGCKAIVSINLANWDTGNVKTMYEMFGNCWVLPILDLSSFNTKNVTNMSRMFFKCEKLVTLYTGDDWSVEQVTSSNMMFNCCYLVEGAIPWNMYYTDKTYATTDGYLTYKESAPTEYTVSYEFVGDTIPNGVTAPDSFTYNKGSVVDVETAPTASGYEFSGWTTEDATVSEGGKFTVNNNVNFVGSWTKLYKVTYKYDKNYEIPSATPLIPSIVYYKPGTVVEVEDIPYAEGYTFVGWDTTDAEVTTENNFTMPAQDVVLYGYFKKPVESIEINGFADGDEIVLNKDGETTISVTVRPDDATVKDIVFESSKPDVATVDENGNIKAVGEGETTITVYSKDDPTKKDEITVTVKIPVTDVEVEENEFTLNKGDKDEIKVVVKPDYATEKGVTYTSSKPDIVKVDENGNIEAVGEGTATITVSSKDNADIKEVVTVTVKIPVTEIKVEEELEIEIGESANLKANVNDDATNKTLTYESNDETVVTVDEDGNITAIGEGTATITVKSEDNPDITEEVKVTVYKKYNVSYVITGDVIPEGATAPVGNSYRADTTVDVEDVLSFEGYTFYGWTTDVTVTDGKFTMPERDVVLEGYFTKDVKDITVDKTEIDLEEGGTDKITVTVTPDDATDKSVTYESSNEDVVKVDENGNITAVGEGEAIITVTSNSNKDEKVEIKVTVTKPEPEKVPVTDITVDKSVINLEPGDEETITVTVTPDDATEKGVTFESSNPEIAEVTEDGTIVAKKDGTTTITVKSEDNSDVVETVTVTVVARKYKVTYEYEGDVPASAPAIEKRYYKTGSTVIVENAPAVEGYTFSGWTSADADITSGEFKIYNDVVIIGKWTQNPGPVTGVTVPEDFTMVLGEETVLEAYVNKNAINKGLTFESLNPDIATVDENGNVKALAEGAATIRVRSAENPAIYADVVITVTIRPQSDTRHYIVFGKTEKIGFYKVSLDGGKTFFTQFGNDHLEVEKGTEIIVKAVDVFGDPFTFYVNGEAMTPDENGYVHILVDRFILIGALGIPVVAPDAEESMSLIQQIIQKIKEFFAKIAEFFKF